MRAPLSTITCLLLGLCLLIGCGANDGENLIIPTAPGSVTPSILGVYAAPTFWTFEALLLSDGTTLTWSCAGRVTVLRQSGTDFLGTFALNPPDGQRCEAATGNLTGGIIRRDARVSFDTRTVDQDPDEFFALPGCAVASEGGLWNGRANGDGFVASRRMTVDCPVDGRMQITARVDGQRTTG